MARVRFDQSPYTPIPAEGGAAAAAETLEHWNLLALVVASMDQLPYLCHHAKTTRPLEVYCLVLHQIPEGTQLLVVYCAGLAALSHSQILGLTAFRLPPQ